MERHQFMLCFAQISAMLLGAWAFGFFLKKQGHSPVLGELIGGILLGPSGLGNIYPALYTYLFYSEQEVNNTIEALARLGLLLFMFTSGLEINLNYFRRHKRLIAFTSIFGGIIPFLLGFSLVWLSPQMWGADHHTSRLALFMGTLFAISALPVIARILIDLGLIDSKIGLTILTSAMVIDIAGCGVFSCLLADMQKPGSDWDVISVVAPLGLYIGFLLTFGRWALSGTIRFLAVQNWPGGLLTFLAGLIFLVAAGAGYFGIHDIFAVFLLGMIIGQEGECDDRLKDVQQAITLLQNFSLNFFAPIYFVSVGMKVNLNSDFDLLLTLGVIVLASVGKILGAGLGARLGGMNWREAVPVGIGLNARGAVGLVFISVALEQHMISQSTFTILAIMVLATSLMSGFLLKFLLVRN